jgi:hypothetical protein
MTAHDTPADPATAAGRARLLADPIGDAGGRWLLAREVLDPAKGNGYPNGFVYYFLGRGGVLGDVDADVVTAAFGFFRPSPVRTMWELGLAVEPPRQAAARYGAACADYGRAHLAGFGGAGRFAALAERMVDAAPVIGLSLFAGWRAQDRPEDPAGRAQFMAHVLREWRGSAHVVAAAATGLTPLESILTRQGSDRAKLFGWSEPFDDVEHLAERREQCEATTDEICAMALDSSLDAAEQSELVDLSVQLLAAMS